uniref:C2H2-type domain-containing protein n=1 Tax=viral metagenome TaxID=1070528 RepID=A0A6C0DI10_9ZZZZ
MKQNETEKVAKVAQKYKCEFCDYITFKLSSFNKHTTTLKHTVNANETQMKQKVALTLKCSVCELNFKSRTTLWRHKQKCINNNTILLVDKENDENQQFHDNNTNKIINDSTDNDNNDENDQNKNTIHESPQMEILINLFQEQLKENKELKELIIEQQKKILEMGPGTTNNITNNNTMNNKFNLNVFLNETCKDALNLSDFLESLILTLTDFENFGPLGYCGGISNILVNGLNKLDISKRPIHCSDLKREVIHIKNNDTWHKDDDKQQMIKAIKAIEHKNVKQMSLWAKANPEYKDPNHKKSDLYTKLIDQSLGETDKDKALKNYNKIIRTVAKEILVDKN